MPRIRYPKTKVIPTPQPTTTMSQLAAESRRALALAQYLAVRNARRVKRWGLA
jgi:hypothetical protein